MTAPQPNLSRKPIWRHLVVAALLLGVSAARVFLSPQHLGEELAERLLGIVVGAAVVFYSNALPKALTPLARMRCDPATEQALRRFTGWSLTTGGAGYTLTWMLAPLEAARVLAPCIVGTALLLVILRVVRDKARGARA